MTQPQQFSYQDALQLAVALGATAASEQVVTSVVSGLSDQVANTRDTAVTWAFRLIRQVWQRTDPYDGDAVAAFTTAAGARMSTAQTTVARSAAASVTQGLAVMGIHTPAVASDPVDVRRLDAVGGKLVPRQDTTTVDYQDTAPVQVDLVANATTDGMFNRPAQKYRYAVSQGASTHEADRAAQQLIFTQIDQNAMLAARLAYAETLQKTVDLNLPGPKIIGYRRIIHPEFSRTGTCGLCIAASDRLYHIEDLLPIHNRCHCTVAAVTADRDPADALNKVDLAALYRQAGGVGGTPTTNAPALKRIRYQVDEHGELGPVLIPKKAHKPRKTVTAPGRSKTRVS